MIDDNDKYFTIDDVANALSADYTCPKCGGKRNMVIDSDTRKEIFVCEPCLQKVNELFKIMANDVQ